MDSTFLIFALASAAIILVPGPTVTVIVANSLRDGAKAGLLNVAGTQAGLAIMVVVVAFGLEVVTTSLAFVFDWIRYAGAAYLVWLGWRLLRSDGALTRPEASSERVHGTRYFWQGFLVIWSNPKALLFFGSFLPPFVDPSQSAFVQTLILGGIFMLVGLLGDGFYAVLAGRAGRLLKRERVRFVERVSGVTLVGGGVWLALNGRGGATA